MSPAEIKQLISQASYQVVHIKNGTKTLWGSLDWFEDRGNVDPQEVARLFEEMCHKIPPGSYTVTAQKTVNSGSAQRELPLIIPRESATPVAQSGPDPMSIAGLKESLASEFAAKLIAAKQEIKEQNYLATIERQREEIEAGQSWQTKFMFLAEHIAAHMMGAPKSPARVAGVPAQQQTQTPPAPEEVQEANQRITAATNTIGGKIGMQTPALLEKLAGIPQDKLEKLLALPDATLNLALANL